MMKNELLGGASVRPDQVFDHLIGGESSAAASGQSIAVVNPTTGAPLCRISRGGPEDIDRAVKAAQQARGLAWGSLTALERGRLLMSFSREILANRDQIAEIEALDTGKPRTLALNDVAALARYFEYYGGAADKVHGETIPYQNGISVSTIREPYGVTGHIIPWNYPVQMFGRSVAPALAMGNACVVKPAEDASLTSLLLGHLALAVGFPPGALNVVTGLGHEAGAALAAHPGVGFLSFTGSPRVGILVQQAAALHYMPVALELGGKSPQIVFADADQDKALPVIVAAITQNAGQTCSAGSRLLLQDDIYDEFTEKLADRFKALTVGPGSMNADIGPVINRTQRTRIQEYIDLAQQDQLTFLAQGRLVANAPKDGYFVLPTLLGDVPARHRLAQEEIFGPVLTVTRFTSEDEAVAIANDTPYGLAAGVWTENGGRQLRLAHALRCGQVHINNYGAGGGIELPFGGVKSSGHGREKGFEALFHFSTTKTVTNKYSS